MQVHRFLAAAGGFDQCPFTARMWSRHGAAAQKVAGGQVTTVDGVMRHHLCDTPVRMVEIGQCQTLGFTSGIAHLLRFER